MMRCLIPRYNTKEDIETLLNKNGIHGYSLTQKENGLLLELPEKGLSRGEKEAVLRHFSFYNLFHWSDKGVENVVLWEDPSFYPSLLREMKILWEGVSFDLIASLESRGFILGGLFSLALEKPFLPIRKYKHIFSQLPGKQAEYVNWKGETETLYLFTPEASGKRILFIDDILETGRSLKASVALLEGFGFTLAGAFYLLDAATEETRSSFPFPIRSLLRFDQMTENTPLQALPNK
ncbi:MAG TPA: phosphoribosyltransferase family protein [Candidatus Mcinerneyibacteriales bacterium]|nr:phosphoribosyltransferase family protein [Candidatus Mcinerneyibacteriales bacterium]